ncbi:MAG: hypothetical protein H6713_33950 [Myxococcales bacterium]|nr:hypothetical protein [Myxococcales bacterium]
MSAQSSIESLLAAGKTIRAIVRFSELTGASFNESRAAIDHYVECGRWRPWQRAALRMRSWHKAIAEAQGSIRPDPQIEIEQRLRAGQTNQAIQLFADHAGINPFSAKRAVDHYRTFGLWLPHDLALLDDDGRAEADAREPPPGPVTRWGADAVRAITWLIEHELRDAPDTGEVHWVAAVDVTSFRGYIVMFADRGCVVYRHSGAWHLGVVFQLKDVAEAALHRGVFGTELHLRVGFVRSRVAFLLDSDARDILELLLARIEPERA